MSEITITIKQNGPYRIEGDDVAKVRILDHTGAELRPPGKVIALCRCGGSSTKPFCDGTHSKIGFRGAEEAVREQDAAKGQT